ncbi:AlpA family transcriptional regulator [Desulfopila sp. IMCC35008]|uniref:helix-turn-helix transcriptional regulator n=1 Tax=Desulfopila sp. IMCC35008 TaxID=2653858 RepID=UPI0013D50AB9|nr:helix-turn-helix domain-containing protein [Desulfopila sp. IMCC35008]
MEASSNDRLLQQDEVKEMLGLADSTLEQWRLKGKGPKFVKLGRAVRYRLSDVQHYISSLPCFGSTTEADHQREAQV